VNDNIEDTLQTLPVLPQVALLRHAVAQIRQHDEVVAVWLGGSFAVGNADQYSDLDLRIAVPSAALEIWKTVDVSVVFGQKCVGEKIQMFGPSAFLRHVLTKDGQLIDLFVQDIAAENPEHAILVLACRDEQFARKLAQFQRPVEADYPPADAAIIRSVIVEFWLNTHKHRKVLHRGLDTLVLTGLQFDRANLSRLWYAWLTGNDIGEGRPTIHGMSRVLRTVQDRLGDRALAVLGAGTSDRASLCRSIEESRDEVAKVGRELAAKLDFEYPEGLERAVRVGWNEFVAC
jgi:predicted nucleotidyltransferase